MEAKLNIVNILKNKQKGTKLYADAFGELSFEYISINIICTRTKEGMFYSFYNNGKYDKNGESILVPSKEMRDWNKFAWKKGDLLINSCGFQCIFKEWASDDYTKFNGCYSNSRDGYEDVSNVETAKFDKLDNNTAYEYVRKIERKLGGKLNLKTLEIEKQSEFKDGDIVVYKCEIDDVPSTIFIFRGISQRTPYYSYYASLNSDGFLSYKLGGFGIYKRELRLATEEEKEQLFSALAKKNKAWDAEKKQIVDLKLKWTPKPFDKVVVRCGKADKWSIDFFSYKVHNGYICTGDAWFGYCLPYNEETAHLLGTTDDWEGGEQ